VSRRVLSLVNDWQPGGAQRVAVAQAMALDRSRYDALLVSLEIVPGGHAAGPAADAGLRTYRLRAPGESLAAAAWRLAALLRRDAPAILHTHLAAAGVVGRALVGRPGADAPRLVTTLHNASDFEQRRGSWLRRLDRATLDACARIVCVSDAVREAFARLRPDLVARTVVIRNGVDVDAFHAGAEARHAAREVLGYGPDDLVLGAVARLEARKGLDFLLDACAAAAPRAPRLRVLLVGDGAERAALEARAAAPDLAGRVHFAGAREDVRPYLAALDVFAAPSRSEGLGLALIEALAAGRPVLGADVGGIPEIVLDGVCGRLLPGGDGAAWAEAIVALARDPQMRARLAAGATARAHAFSLADSARRLSEVYDAASAA
jgi:glycosyltransferase involved in cell wall biosynthesis